MVDAPKLPVTIDGLESCWRSMGALLAGLDDDEWNVPSLCPGWTVRDVVVHLAGMEYTMAGETPGSMSDSIPLFKMVDFAAEVAPLSPSALLNRFREVIAVRRAEVTRLTTADFNLPSLIPGGSGTYGRFLAIRVFDWWVHELDIRFPLSIVDHESGPAAETAMNEIERSLPYIVGKKVGLSDGLGITFEIEGPIRRSMRVVVNGRARLVETLENPDVVVWADSTTFALLACGRIDPQSAIDARRIAWTGNPTWGEAAARLLAFTI
jgi:uncharacterized protein (TIGR03083 family)